MMAESKMGRNNNFFILIVLISFAQWSFLAENFAKGKKDLCKKGEGVKIFANNYVAFKFMIKK